LWDAEFDFVYYVGSAMYKVKSLFIG